VASPSSSPAKAAPRDIRIFDQARGLIFGHNDMEAVLKQGDRISRRPYQPHRRAIRRRLFPVSWRPRVGLDVLAGTISKHFGTPLRIPKIDYSAWGYGLRTGCAACLALYISFSLNLDESHWAFTTCYIVGGQRLQGKIMAKSLARIVGTLVGATISFVLVNAFAQHGVLFITFFAVWLAVCAFFSYSRRDDWAYAWVLSGYTTAIVGVPAALAPVSAFDIISSRGENILIGILCMAGVGMIASRELVGDRVTKLVKSMDKDLSDLLSSCLRLTAAPHELTKAVKKLASSAASIDDLRLGLGLEETGTGLTPANIGPFQFACLELASCALNLEAYFSSVLRLPERTEPPCLIRALNRCHETVMDLLQSNRNWNHKDRYDRLQQQLRDLDTLCSFLEEQHRLGFAAGVELAGLSKIRCLLAASQRYLETRSALFSKKPAVHSPSRVHLEAAFDTHAAVLAAVKVFVAVGLAAVFWIATAWPAGDSCLVWVGIGTCRYSITPDPARATQATLRGFLCAVVPTYLLTFYLLPQLDGFTMLVLVLLPLIVVGVGIATSLGRASEAGSAMLLLGSGMDPNNLMQYDVIAFFNGILANIMGVCVVCLTHAITFPTDAAWRRRIAERRLIQRIARALQQPRLIPVGYLGSVVRSLNDYLLLYGNQVEGNPGKADSLIRLYALGYEVSTLELGGEDTPAELLNYRRRLVSAVTQFLQHPSALQLSRAKMLAEEIHDYCERTLTRNDLASSCLDQIVSIMASSAVIRERIRGVTLLECSVR
jgi:uncharacterized membrane protein YccC